MSPLSSSFLDRLRSTLADLAQPEAGCSYVIAYSGGVDSHVMLYACTQLQLPVRAVHIHHGIQAIADHWVEHCERACKQLDVSLEVVYVDGKPQQGKRQSPEEAARIARYQALFQTLSEGDCLVTAQHMDDQAETLVLQLMRGASAAGLAGMPAQSDLDHIGKDAFHIRPFLGFLRSDIENYAYENALDWVDDPSNQDNQIDRNFIRQQIMPGLESRWPQITAQLSQAAAMQAENREILESMAALDLADCEQQWKPVGNAARYRVLSSLSVSWLNDLSRARRMNLLRYWIALYQAQFNASAGDHGALVSAAPTRKLLYEINRSVLLADDDAEPEIRFAGFEFRRYRDSLVLLRDSWTQEQAARENEIRQQALAWSPVQSIRLANMRLRLVLTTQTGVGLSKRVHDSELTLRFRTGGEQIKPAGRHTQSLKKLMQQSAIPPWERDCLPLLFIDDDLVAVSDLFIAEKYRAEPDERGWQIQVEPA